MQQSRFGGYRSSTSYDSGCNVYSRPADSMLAGPFARSVT
jgi:hypothetical protein